MENIFTDTNTLLSGPDAIDDLIHMNGEDNTVYITFTVMMELDGIKREEGMSHIVAHVVKTIIDNPKVIVFGPDTESKHGYNSDFKILDEVLKSGIENPLIVTNDNIFSIFIKKSGLRVITYEPTSVFKTECELYTGFVEDGDDICPNSFCIDYNTNLVTMNKCNGRKVTINHVNTPWKIRPRDISQNLALQALLDPDINIMSIQSPPGRGKSFLALAAALYQTFELKMFEKIFVFKGNDEIGKTLGLLPGGVDEKMAPFMNAIEFLVKKLHRIRNIPKLFNISTDGTLVWNKDKFEILPLSYIQGMNIENSFVIGEEIQNVPRDEGRCLISRMSYGTKMVCIGDTNQIINKRATKFNNTLNYMVKYFKGAPNYAHLTLEGEESRGPITDLLIKSGF